MKRCRGLIAFAIFFAFCAGAVWLTLRATAQYPALGDAVSYPVNQLDGFTLSIEEPVWSPFQGYTIRYELGIDSDESYRLVKEESSFEYLESLVNGTWYRVRCQAEPGFNPLTFAVGGRDTTSFAGSVVQKYAGYGTRLEPGVYRLLLELKDGLENPHYLAAEFEVG